jgi:membrane protein implicated in regulation of membrane protease activity
VPAAGIEWRRHDAIIAWWHWLALGLMLVALELSVAGGFYLLFFGVAAFI